ncbi:MAG: response regulator [Candidatus Marinimicrobia bacterium]|nr:response regulator [bacterium]MCG2715702.1 response regulator [Candidatus Neomarinimicrobiota bacterium]
MSHKILIVDDDIDLVEVLRIVLESHGYDVIDAQDGDRGFRLVEKEKPDLIILDVMMRTEDEGFYIAEKIRSQPDIANIPIIILTAVCQQTGYQYKKNDDVLPVDEFIEKPVMPKTLIKLIQKYIGKN